MASNRSYLVVEVDHRYHVDGIKHSLYCSNLSKAEDVAVGWKTSHTSILIYKCIAEVDIAQEQSSTIRKLND